MWLVLLLTLVDIVVCMDPTTKDLVTPLKQYGEACGYEVSTYLRTWVLSRENNRVKVCTS